MPKPNQLVLTNAGDVLADLKLNKFGGLIERRRKALRPSQGGGGLRRGTCILIDSKGRGDSAADIVGHEKPQITYGLLSNLEVKREALAKLC